MFFSFQLQIPKRAVSCQSCLNPFKHEQVIDSFLTEMNLTWVRLDYCNSCAIEKTLNLNPKLMQWKSKYIEITKFKAEAATHIALNLLMDEEQTSLEEKFILALYLVRKKVLVVRKEKLENFSNQLIYENLQTGEWISLPCFNLLDLSLKTVYASLAKKLNLSLTS